MSESVARVVFLSQWKFLKTGPDSLPWCQCTCKTKKSFGVNVLMTLFRTVGLSMSSHSVVRSKVIFPEKGHNKLARSELIPKVSLVFKMAAGHLKVLWGFGEGSVSHSTHPRMYTGIDNRKTWKGTFKMIKGNLSHVFLCPSS